MGLSISGATVPTIPLDAPPDSATAFSLQLSASLRKNAAPILKVTPFALFFALLFVAAKVNISPRQYSVVSVTATGTNADQKAKASVVWMKTPGLVQLESGRVEVTKSLGWQINQGIFMSLRDQPAELRIRGYFPRDQIAEFITGPYSGEAMVSIDGVPQKMNLYKSQAGKEVVEVASKAFSRTAMFISVIDFLNVLLPPFLFLLCIFFLIYPLYLKFPQFPIRSTENVLVTRKPS